MKTVRNIMFVLVAAVLSGACSDSFEYLHPLTVSQPVVVMPVEGGRHVIVVNTDGGWTASLSQEVGWASIDRTHGEDMGGIGVDCQENTGLARAVEVIVRRDSYEARVTVKQEGKLTKSSLSFRQASLSLPCAALNVCADIETNVTDLSGCCEVEAVDGLGNKAGWISDISIEDSRLTFAVSDTNVERVARIVLTARNAVDSALDVSAELKIIQTADNPYFVSLQTAPFPAEGAVVTIPAETNLTNSMYGFYPLMAASQPWAVVLSEESCSSGVLTLQLEQNQASQSRECTVTLPYRDLNGNSFSFSFNLVQNGTDNI